MLVAMLRSWRDKTELIVMMCKTHACSNEVIWSRCNSTISTFNIAQSFLFTFFKRFNFGQNSCLNQSFSMLCTQRNGMYGLKSIPKKKNQGYAEEKLSVLHNDYELHLTALEYLSVNRSAYSFLQLLWRDWITYQIQFLLNLLHSKYVV